MERFDFSEVQDRACREIENAAGNANELLAALQRVIDEAEQKLTTAEEFDDSLIDCRAGCGSCCVVNVSVLLPEGLAIAAYLGRLSSGERSGVIERLDELWRSVRGLSDEERISLRQSCAFLDDAGNCRIYTVRPLLCRSITSTSAENCREALVDDPFFGSSPVLMNLYQRQLYEAVYVGVGEGLQRAGLDGRSVKLTGLVRHLVKHPESGERLLSGKKINWHDLA